MHKNYLQLKNIDAYRIALNIAQSVWKLVVQWDHFSRDTLGKQFVRSADSISANIAEGFGRYSKKDKIHFYRYAFGSMKEFMDWLLKAKFRGKVSEDDYRELMRQFNILPREIYSLIHFTNMRLKI